MHILIIDPDPVLRHFVADIFHRAGHTVRQAGDAESAAAQLRLDAADVVLTDLGSRGSGGALAIEALRNEFPDVEIIAISAAPGSAGYLRLAASLGARRTLAEPFMSRELRALVTEIMTGVAAHQAHLTHQATRVASGSN